MKTERERKGRGARKHDGFLFLFTFLGERTREWVDKKVHIGEK